MSKLIGLDYWYLFFAFNCKQFQLNGYRISFQYGFGWGHVCIFQQRANPANLLITSVFTRWVRAESRVFPRGVRAESPVISLTWISVAAATGKMSVIVLGNIQPRPGSILCCGSGMFIPETTFFHPGSEMSIPEPGSALKIKKWFLSSIKYDPEPVPSINMRK